MGLQEYTTALNAKLEKARDAYYKKGEPVMSDAEYDAQEKELADIISANPQLKVFAPVLHTVGSDVTASGRVKHSRPMLSIENKYTVDDFVEWAKKIWAGYPDAKFCLEPKFDGVSVELRYRHGKLHQAVSRGTGSEGEDCTLQVMAIKSIPKTVPNSFPNVFDIRGEMVMRNDTLERLNAEAQKYGGKIYQSTRNLTAGTMKKQDAKIVASRDLEYRPWEVTGSDLNDSGFARLDMLVDAGFVAPLGELVEDEASLRAVLAKKLKERTTKLRDILSLETDGVVIKVDSNALRTQLGVASKYTNWQTCFKPQSASGTTYLRSIEWQVGRTGKLSPVAECDPVILASAKVEHASLNNISWIKEKGLKLGAKVEMLRSGDVIPQIVRVIDEGDDEIIPPTKCPECAGKVVEMDEGGVGIIQHFCTNQACPGILRGYLAFIGSRDVLEIDGLGPEAARTLVKEEGIHDLAGLFNFYNRCQDKRLSMDTNKEFIAYARMIGFDATLPKMLDSLEKAKTAPWERWIKALGIPMIGETHGKALVTFFKLTPESFKDLWQITQNLEENKIEGIGPQKIKALSEWGANPDNKVLCLSLFNLGVRPTPPETPKIVAGAPLSGIIFCITGEFDEDRNSLIKKLVSLGAESKTGVTKKINLLIVGDDAGKTKLTKAAELGIKQVGKDWLVKTLSDSGIKMSQNNFVPEQA
jgi:DNA ligase (NAD+)